MYELVPYTICVWNSRRIMKIDDENALATQGSTCRFLQF